MTERYTLICGTNRRDAISLYITSLYQEILAEHGVQAGIMALHQLPHDFAFSAL